MTFKYKDFCKFSFLLLYLYNITTYTIILYFLYSKWKNSKHQMLYIEQ